MANFLDLPSELRNQVYELCLLHEEPIDPWDDYGPQRELTLGLLLANKTVHREATSFFYAQNCFDFTLTTPEDVASFLETIGRDNADYIRHIRIDFPNLRDLEPGNVTIEEDNIGIFAHIRSACANLSTLKTSLDSTDAMVYKLDTLDHPNVVNEALTLVNTQFRAFLHLSDIIVKMHEDNLTLYMKTMMENHGWTLSLKERIEEWNDDRSFSDFEDYGDRDYGYEDEDYNDDYDIDNDSDFWRRAGD